ncbi:hypothetical protein [Myxococcus sp. CA033]|uniref:DUF6959 family protein n=1 Tax=Myxococcus sp. CA033 TaxID=2741516 RepID=UPI00352F92EC
MFAGVEKNAVIRFPGRRFPGVVIQGDTLHSLVTTASELCATLGQGATRMA